MAKKKTTPQNRKATSAAITRAKAKKLWWARFRRRVVVTAIVAIGGYAVIGSWWMWRSGNLEKAMEFVDRQVTDFTKDAGLELREIEIVGNDQLSADMIRKQAKLSEGQPLLLVSLTSAAHEIRKLPEVRSVSMQRALPNRLIITVDERRPVAIWQNGGDYKLIDQDGIVLENRALDTSVKGVLLVVGADAPEHTQDLRTWLNDAQTLSPFVDSAVRVGKRRWDIHLKNGVKVMLPEDHPDDAWRELEAMEKEKAILAKSVEVIDMRIDGKLFLQLKEGEDSADSTPSMRRDI